MTGKDKILMNTLPSVEQIEYEELASEVNIDIIYGHFPTNLSKV